MKKFDRVVVSYITNPYLNLALENDLLENIGEGQRVLFLYRNRPCVVMGRFQNPWIECNLKAMHQRQVSLVRRQSGGGTVYQDLGNVNFSIIADKKIHNQKWNHNLLVEALKDLKVESYATERGDVRLSDGTDRKISGSAFKQKKSQAFHHGTMLINSNLDELNIFLHSDKQSLETKSIASVRSVVANISELNSDINYQHFIFQFIETFMNYSDVRFVEFFNENDMTSKSILDYAAYLQDIDWKIGETPKFIVEHQFDERLRVHMTIKKQIIEQIEFFSDQLHPSFLCELQNHFFNQKIERENIKFICLNLSKYDQELASEIENWFKSYFSLDLILFL